MIKYRKKLFFVSLIIIFGILLFCLINIIGKNKSVQLESVKLNKIDNKNFAIMLEKSDGSGYEEIEEFPLGAIFNAELSGCIDFNNNEIESSIEYDSNLNSVKIKSKGSVYCYLYFNKDITSPEIFTFYIGGSNNPEYAVNTSSVAYLNWTDADITYYCVTNIQGSENCDWQSVTVNTVNANHTLTSGDGTKTVYAYIKDGSGNVSPEVSDTIILDTAAPTSNSVSINSGATYTTSTSVTLALSSSGASQMCISNTTSCSSWVTYATSKSHTLATGDGTKTVYVWYRDAAGNTISYVSDTIILDTVAPTVTASASSNNTNSPKISITSSEAGTYCVNTTSTATNFSNCTLTGSISANTSLTTSSLSSSGTYYVHIKDSVGNVGGSSAVSITVFTSFAQYLIDNNVSGLQKSYVGVDTLYRFRGASGNTGINNYICLGATSCTVGSEEMYRIIGVEPSTGYVKILRPTFYGSAGPLHPDPGYDLYLSWPETDTFTTLNNTYYNSLSFKNMVVEYTQWGVGTGNLWSSTGAIESELATTTSAKIGIVSWADFMIASTQSYDQSLDYINNNWITGVNNGTALSTDTYREWTMPFAELGFSGLIIYTSSFCGAGNTQNILLGSNSLRPTFYLSNKVIWKSGTGTSSDPFIVELSS